MTQTCTLSIAVNDQRIMSFHWADFLRHSHPTILCKINHVLFHICFDIILFLSSCTISAYHLYKCVQQCNETKDNNNHQNRISVHPVASLVKSKSCTSHQSGVASFLKLQWSRHRGLTIFGGVVVIIIHAWCKTTALCSIPGTIGG